METNRFKKYDCVVCNAPNGWDGDGETYKGHGITRNFPEHGKMYVITGFDDTTTPPGLYLNGISAKKRPHDNIEISFSETAFVYPEEMGIILLENLAKKIHKDLELSELLYDISMAKALADNRY